MNITTKVESFIDTLCDKYSFSWLPVKDKAGQASAEYHLFFDDIQMSCFEASGRFHLRTTLLTLPKDNQERQLIVARYLRQALTYIKSFPVSMVVEQDELVLFYQRPLTSAGHQADYAYFEQVVEAFLNAIEFFQPAESEPEPSFVVADLFNQTMMIHP